MTTVSILSQVNINHIHLTCQEARVIELALFFLSDELIHGSPRPHLFKYTGADIQRLSSWIHQRHSKLGMYLDDEVEMVMPKISREDVCLLILAVEYGVTLQFLEWYILEETNLEKEMAEDYCEIYRDNQIQFNFQERLQELKKRYLPMLAFKSSVLLKLMKTIFIY